MIHWYREGGQIQTGLNVYHPSEYKRNIGFVVRISRGIEKVTLLRFRIAPLVRKIHFTYEKFKLKETQELWLNEPSYEILKRKTISIPYWRQKNG